MEHVTYMNIALSCNTPVVYMIHTYPRHSVHAMMWLIKVHASHVTSHMIIYHMATVHSVIFAALIFCCAAQEFSFTASCDDQKFSTNVDDKLDKLIDTCIMSRDSLTSTNSTTLDLTCLPSSYVPGSCKDIQDKWPSSTSGYYTIATANGSTSTVYCHMEDLCDTLGPWTRVAHLDMKDRTQSCPSGFCEATSNGVRACWR